MDVFTRKPEQCASFTLQWLVPTVSVSRQRLVGACLSLWLRPPLNVAFNLFIFIVILQLKLKHEALPPPLWCHWRLSWHFSNPHDPPGVTWRERIPPNANTMKAYASYSYCSYATVICLPFESSNPCWKRKYKHFLFFSGGWKFEAYFLFLDSVKWTT